MHPPTNDRLLLREYALNRSPEVLGRLVERHIDFVFSAARRQLRDQNSAEDVTQAVFIILGKKAGSIRATSLAGWLFNTTRHCARNVRRAEMRRSRHERQGAKREACMPADSTEVDQSSENLKNILDEGIASLGHTDREVVLMRYLQGREFSDLSASLGISESAARKRLNRAVARLRRYFANSGASVTPIMVIGALETSSGQAPAHLLHSAMAATFQNSTAHTVSGVLAARTMRVMGWAKVKIAVGIILTVIIAGAGTATLVHHVMAKSPASVSASGEAGPAVAGQPSTAPTPFAAGFSDGMKVEFIGLSENPSKGKPWWRADGSPLAKAPYTESQGFVSGIGTTSYEMVVRVRGGPKGLDYSWSDGGASWDIPDVRGGPDSVILCRAFSQFFSSPTTARVLFATQPVQIRAAVTPDAVRDQAVTINGVIFEPPHQDPSGFITLTVSHDYLDEDWRVVAIDLGGKMHHSSSHSAGLDLSTQKTIATFLGLKLARVKEFRFISRPYDRWVEFQNVSLRPGEITTVQVQTSDDAASTK